MYSADNEGRFNLDFDLDDVTISEVLQAELVEDLARETAEAVTEEAEPISYESGVLAAEDVVVAVPWYVGQTTEDGEWYRKDVSEKGAGAAPVLATATGMNTEFILRAINQGQQGGLLEVTYKESSRRPIPVNLRLEPAGRQFVETLATAQADQLRRIVDYITDYKMQNIQLMRSEVFAEQQHLSIKKEILTSLGDLSMRQLNQHMADLKAQQTELLERIENA